MIFLKWPLLFNLTIICFNAFPLLTAKPSKVSKLQSRRHSDDQSQEHSKVQSSSALTYQNHYQLYDQCDYLITPNDFDEDENVRYLVKELHKPQIVVKFYKSAAQIYSDLPLIYNEIQSDPEIASKFLDIMKRLADANLNCPLTVTNFIFAIGKHLRLLFKTKCDPIEQIGQIIKNMEAQSSRIMIVAMTRFFYSFTLREVVHLQNFIKIVSCATLTADDAAAMARDKRSSGKKSRTSIASTPNTNTNTTISGALNISRTQLKYYAERIAITLSNAISKMLILLDLFLSDPSVMERSESISIRLWSIHLKRLSQKKRIPIEELDVKYFDPAYYRKSAVNFSFEDWSPKGISLESMEALKRAAEMELRDVEAKKLAARLKESESTWSTTTLLTLISILSLAAVLYYIRHRKQLKDQEIAQDQDQDLDDDFVMDDTIVSKLEENI